MIKRFPYLIFPLLLSLLFLQCEDENKNKIDYQGKLKYFSDQYGQEHFIAGKKKKAASIVLPTCFYTHYATLSLTNENNFYCSEKQVYVSVDVIPKTEIDHYAEYFNEDKIKNQIGVKIIRDYIVEIRDYGLINSTRSIYSTLNTKNGVKMYLGSVKGYKNPNDKELFYQFGVVDAVDNYYVLQSITSVNNTPFLHQDLVTIFKSFKIH